MRILVTGSSGTIGTRLCERLLASGHDVVGVDWVKNKWQPSIDAITTMCDLRDAEAMKAIPTDVEAIIHLAANARVYELVEDPDRALDNMKTVYNTLEFARKNNIKKFIFASSRESYGNIKVDTYTEDLVRVENCESPYTASKIAGEALVHSYRRCYGLTPIILRFSNVYGMYDDSDRVIPLFIRQAQAKKNLTVFGGEKCLDFTYIDDTVTGIMQCFDHYEAAQGDCINLAFGEGTTLVHLAETLNTLLGSDAGITVKDNRKGEVIRYIADISKAKRILGYEPKTSFEEGIRKAVEWYTTWKN